MSYEKCPRNYAKGVWWDPVPFGDTAVKDCPEGAFGQWLLWWTVLHDNCWLVSVLYQTELEMAGNGNELWLVSVLYQTDLEMHGWHSSVQVTEFRFLKKTLDGKSVFWKLEPQNFFKVRKNPG